MECVEDMTYKQEKNIHLIIIVAGAAGGVLFIIAVAVTAFCCCARKRKKEKDGEKIVKKEPTRSKYIIAFVPFFATRSNKKSSGSS